MYGIALTISLLASLFVLTLTSTNDVLQAEQRAHVASLAENLSIYQSHVKRFLSTNPGHTGTVSDASLGLPSWYGKQENMTVYIASGKAYVYLVGNGAGLLSESAGYVRDRTKLASWGVKNAGFVSTAEGKLLPVPSQVPEGAFVIVM